MHPPSGADMAAGMAPPSPKDPSFSLTRPGTMGEDRSCRRRWLFPEPLLEARPDTHPRRVSCFWSYLRTPGPGRSLNHSHTNSLQPGRQPASAQRLPRRAGARISDYSKLLDPPAADQRPGQRRLTATVMFTTRNHDNIMTLSNSYHEPFLSRLATASSTASAMVMPRV